ncbi:dethiobiotin synthase [Adhaeribacter aquaticus]|uniref:dethiobiotin synthase n=1 Tax=Adhaeribacter aquaticus TaxID=299567 RepID=UPI000404B00D|nr:dethiobiotin synthase [Adhaeribacter aquaticus]
MKKLFVTGIGTEIGKTVSAAILTEALQADYWKPVQSGSETDSDAGTVKSLISNTSSVFHPESYLLKAPLSPHAAAELENITIDPNQIHLPETDNHLVIEGAGGLFVPLNNNYLIVDLIQQLQAEVVVVSKNYLGSINHTLLTIEALNARQIPIAGIIFNGDKNNQTEDLILRYTGLRPLLHISPEATLTPAVVQKYAALVKPNLI